MSVETAPEHKGTPLEPHHESHQHEHPSDRNYFIVAIILGVITAAEVSTYYFEDLSTTALIIWLFPMMIAKFIIVAAYFMHLKYDNPIFKRVFVFGLVLAMAVFGIALTAFDFWSAEYLRFLR